MDDVKITQLRNVCALMGAICVAAGSPGQGAERARGDNLVPNAGFEEETVKAGLPDGWTLSVRPEDTGQTNGQLSRAARSGRYSFCVEQRNGSQGATLISPRFELKAGTAYEVSAWLRMEGGRLPKDTVTLRVTTDGGNRSFDFTATRRWRRATAILLTGAGTTFGNLELQRLADVADRVFIDDVAVRETDAKGGVPVVHKTDLAAFEFARQRPRVEHTAAEIEEMKRSLAGSNVREHEWVKAAEPWLERQLFFYEEGCGPKYYSAGVMCPVCGAQLRGIVHPDGATEMECPKCGKRYREEAHRAVGRAWVNCRQASGAQALGRAYALTGDLRFARRAAEILLGFAGHYKEWGGGHAAHYTLHEPYAFLTPCAAAYDYIYDSGVLSAEERGKVEENLLRVGAEFYSQQGISDRLNNRSAVYSEAVMAIGVAIGDKGFVDHAINNPYAGFHTLAAHLYLPDGLSWEGFGYHTYTVSGLAPIAEKAYRVGINVYGDPAYRRIFEAPLAVLLPGEELIPKDYEVVCRRLAEIGLPLEYPFGAADLPSRMPSHLFDQFGFGVLRRGEGAEQIYLSMEYGKEAMFMGHAPGVKFSPRLFANGRLLTARDTHTYEGELGGGWNRRSLAHNTITVDDRDQWTRTTAGVDPGYAPRKLVAFATAPRVKVVRARDDEVYGGVTLDRTLFLADGYVVDLSGARGSGDSHRFDLSYRIFGKLSCGLPFQPRKGPLGANHGYQYLTDVRSARTAAAWSADWRQAEESALRLSVLGDAETEVLACASPPDDRKPDENGEAIVARRWGEGTVFASVWEPYRDTPRVSRVRRLQVQGAGDSQGVGVEVVQEGQAGADCFLVTYAPGKKRFGDIELDGKIAAGRWRSAPAAPEYLYLVKGVLLKRGAHSIEANAPATLYVEQAAPGRLLVKSGSESAGTLTLRGRLPGAVTVQRDGQPVTVNVAQGRTLTFDVAQDASYDVTGVTEWQRIRLVREGPAEAEEAAAVGAASVAAAPAPKAAIRASLAPDGTLAGKNKVANGGFEVSGETDPEAAGLWSFWSSYHFVKFRAKCHYDTEVAHSGRGSLKIANTNWYGAVSQDAWAVQKVPGSWANKTVTLSAWVKANLAPTRVRLCIYGLNPKWGNDFEGGVSPVFEIGTEWQRITWTRTFGPDITDVRVMMKREHQVFGGDLWIDDVQLEEGTEATGFAPDAWTQAAEARRATPRP
ncbi:MAG: alginate lyase family protein [Armatimonadetes bacterium]|nr:alginate lyase family protein [Armatimonadota bacterium]